MQVFRRLGAVPGIYAALAVATAVLFAPASAGREFLAAVTPAFAVLGASVGPRGMLGEALRFCSLGLLLLRLRLRFRALVG